MVEEYFPRRPRFPLTRAWRATHRCRITQVGRALNISTLAYCQRRIKLGCSGLAPFLASQMMKITQPCWATCSWDFCSFISSPTLCFLATDTLPLVPYHALLWRSKLHCFDIGSDRKLLGLPETISSANWISPVPSASPCRRAPILDHVGGS